MNRLYLAILSALIFVGCNRTPNQVSDNFSSPKYLFSSYINSCTGGVISVGSDIRLKLAKSVSDSITNIPLSEDIFSFSPAIDGNISWGDNKTVQT